MKEVALRDLAGGLDVAAARYEVYGREMARAGDTQAAHDAAVVTGVLSGLAFAFKEAAKREPGKAPRS